MAATTADLVLYEGVYDDLIAHWDRLVESRLFFDCGASRNAYKHEGKKTIGYEIAEQSGWRPPDVVVAPVAVGETFIAAARAFREMHRAGFIPRVPRMVAAQATRANAISRAFRGRPTLEPLKIGYTVAEGLAAGNPGRQGASGCCGCCARATAPAGDAEDEEILEMQRDAVRARRHLGRTDRGGDAGGARQDCSPRRSSTPAVLLRDRERDGAQDRGGAASRSATAFDYELARPPRVERLARA